MEQRHRKYICYLAVSGAVGLGLYATSIRNYLLFHSLIEITTISIGFTLFILTWNTRRIHSDGCLKILGVGYAFAALVDLFHTLSYKGMMVLPSRDGNLPTQLWIAARYLQAGALVLAPFFARRPVRDGTVFLGFFCAFAALCVAVGVGVFPDCFLPGIGLTLFKVASEYVIVGILAISLFLFARRRESFDHGVYLLVLGSVTCTAVSELSFTAYLTVYDLVNMLGHLLKLVAFYLLYRALLATGFQHPLELIFRNLKKAEQALREEQGHLEERIAQRTAELAASREKYQALIECAADAVFIHEVGDDGMPGPFLEVNEAACRSLGYTREELVNLSPLELDAPRYRNRVAATMEVLLREGRALFETAQVAKDGRSIPVEVSTRLAEIGGRRILISLARDISARQDAERLLRESEERLLKLTEELERRVGERTDDLNRRSADLAESQKALMNLVEDLNLKTEELESANEKLKELDRLKSMFIASMSHELRTPLNSIIGFSSIMLHRWTGPITDEQEENLEIILRSGRHLLNLINDVIDVSRIEAGKVDAVVQEFELGEVVEEAVSLVRKELDDKGLCLKLEGEGAALATDRRRLLQGLLNLLSNAVKFTKQGSVTVTMRRDGEEAAVAVSDTGIGIDAGDLPRICQPFVRLAPEEGVPGTGLGLYLTHKLVTGVLKGRLTVESEPGKGSRFSINIPTRLS